VPLLLLLGVTPDLRIWGPELVHTIRSEEVPCESRRAKPPMAGPHEPSILLERHRQPFPDLLRIILQMGSRGRDQRGRAAARPTCGHRTAGTMPQESPEGARLIAQRREPWVGAPTILGSPARGGRSNF